MERKNEIIDYYFMKHLKAIEIKEKLNVSLSSITRAIKEDSRYKQEKSYRKQASKETRKKSQRILMKNKREEPQRDNYNIKAVLNEQHNKDIRILSNGSHLNNEAFRKWNYSAYKYNPSKNRYEFDESLGRSYAVPKYIKER